ncbi:MAG: sigma-70 family RNA polymerase sigma factor, partial [Clostridia bacterium]|nr:sigma-70 family RNA polymerase sigma factor [Clostridia bacterium]
MGISFVEENKILSDDEIISRFRANDFDCIQLLIDRYMPLVLSTAKSFDVSSIEAEELIAEGVFAIFSAVKKYDPEKSKFSTFVSLCIKSAMTDQLR